MEKTLLSMMQQHPRPEYDDLSKAITMNNEGVKYMEQGSVDLTKECFEFALHIAETLSSVIRLITSVPSASASDTPLTTTDHHSPTQNNANHNNISLIANMPSIKVSENYLSRNRYYDEGMDCFCAPMSLSSQSNPECIYGTILFNLGCVYQRRKEYEDAFTYFQKSIRVVKQTMQCRGLLMVAALCGLGYIQYIRGQNCDALRTYETSLDIATTEFGTESLEVATCLNCIGVMQLCMEDCDKSIALESLSTSLHIRMEKLGEDDAVVGTTWNNLGRVHYACSNFDESDIAFRRALHIRKEIYNDIGNVAATSYNLGMVLQHQKRNDEALSQYYDCVRYITETFGCNHDLLCRTYTFIGQVLLDKRKISEAHIYFDEALKVGRMAFGTDNHVEISIHYTERGNSLFEIGEYESAIESYRKGLQIDQLLYGFDSSRHITNYDNIGRAYKDKGEFNQALMYYEIVLSLRRSDEASSDAIATDLSEIGWLRLQINDNRGAIAAYEEFITIKQSLYGRDDSDCAYGLLQMGTCWMELRVFDKALNATFEGYSILKTVCPCPIHYIAAALYRIAYSYQQLGHYDTALRFYFESLEAFSKETRNESLEVLSEKTQTERPEVLSEKTQAESPEVLSQETQTESPDVLSDVQSSLSTINGRIGDVCVKLSEYDSALVHYQKALKINHQLCGSYNLECALFMYEISVIELQLGNVKQAINTSFDILRLCRDLKIDDNFVLKDIALWRYEVVNPKAASVA